jgi:hypothetical protein
MYQVRKTRDRTYIFNPHDNRLVYSGDELNNVKYYDLFEYVINQDYVFHFYRVYRNKDKKKLSNIEIYLFRLVSNASRLKQNIGVNEKNLNDIEISGPLYFLVGYASFSANKLDKDSTKIFCQGTPLDVDFYYVFDTLYINKPFRKNNLAFFFQYIFGLFIQDIESIYESRYLDKIFFRLSDASSISHTHCIYCDYFSPTTFFQERVPGEKLKTIRLYNIRPEFSRKNYDNESFQATINGRVLKKSSIHIFLPRLHGDFMSKVYGKLSRLEANGKKGNLGVVLMETLSNSSDFLTSFREFNRDKPKLLNLIH